MPKLYIVLLGGRHPRARIEVHDIAFATGEQLADTWPQLRQHWFGSQDGLHVDAWMEITGLDGHRLSLTGSTPAAGEPRLYLVNLGGYVASEFGEAHRYLPVCARDAAEAKRKAKAQAPGHWDKPHSDAVVDVDDCLLIDVVNGQHLQLLPGEHPEPRWANDYIVLP